MKVQVIETKIVGKSGPLLCEDLVHISDRYIAVIDGATSISRNHTQPAPGRLIAELINTAIGEIAARATKVEFFEKISDQISTRLQAIWPKSEGERPTASLIVYSIEGSEVWVLGDGWAKIGADCHQFRIPYAEAYTFLRCAYLKMLLRDGKTVDELMEDKSDLELIRPFIELQPRIQNRLVPPHGYGVLDGSPHCIEFVQALPVRSGQEVVLASDGYPELCDDLASTEALLASSLRSDPLMITTHPQVKGLRKGQVSFDDRAYIRFKVLS